MLRGITLIEWRVKAVRKPTYHEAIHEDATEQTMNLTGITAGGGELQPLAVTTTSSDPSLIPNPAVTYTSTGSEGSLVFTPALDQYGMTTITITVTDGGLDDDLATTEDNLSQVCTFNVTVRPVNDLPTLDAISNLTITEDDPQQTLTLSGITTGGGGTTAR